MLRKLKTKKGSAMSVAIISIVLVSIVGSSITMMVNNQMKVSHRNSKNMDLKYDTETGVEEVIGTFIEDISIINDNSTSANFDILKSYIDLSDILVGSKGNVDGVIGSILSDIKAGIVTKAHMERLVIRLEELYGINGNNSSTSGGSNLDAKELAKVARDYAAFIRDNFFIGQSLNSSSIDAVKAKNFISMIIKNLSSREFKVLTGSHKGEIYYGNIGVVYRDITTLSNKGQIFNGIYTAFKQGSPTTNITSEINELIEKETAEDIVNWANTSVGSKKKIDYLIDKIKSTNYTTNIDEEIYLINQGSYLNEGEINKYYHTSGNPSARDNVSQRLKIVKREIDMLIQWLEVIKGIDPDNIIGGGSILSSSFKVSVPKEVIIKDYDNEVKKTISITPVIENQDVQLITPDIDPDTNSKRYEFNILQNKLGTKVVLDLKIKSKIDDYTIESDVQVRIHSIINADDYKVEYEVINWNKKIY